MLLCNVSARRVCAERAAMAVFALPDRRLPDDDTVDLLRATALFFFAAVFLVAVDFLDAGACLANGFLATDFLATDFLATDFLATDFLATDFLATDFLPARFLTAAVFAVAFLAAVLSTGLRARLGAVAEAFVLRVAKIRRPQCRCELRSSQFRCLIERLVFRADACDRY